MNKEEMKNMFDEILQEASVFYHKKETLKDLCIETLDEYLKEEREKGLEIIEGLFL